MLLWSLTVVALLTLAYLAVTWLRAGPRTTASPGLCFYLKSNLVMDHYQMRDYAPALQKEVELRESDSADANIRAAVFHGEAGGAKRKSVDVVSRYQQVAEPISVIGLIVDVLERENAIVHVDLESQTVRRNRALVNELSARHRATGRPAGVHLRDMEPFVLIKGMFERTGETAGSTVFLAPYGQSDDREDGGPHVRLTCETKELRHEVPSGRFRASCLGKVDDWNATDAVLEVTPLAIFR
jgi:hypothetical protein